MTIMVVYLNMITCQFLTYVHINECQIVKSNKRLLYSAFNVDALINNLSNLIKGWKLLWRKTKSPHSYQICEKKTNTV